MYFSNLSIEERKQLVDAFTNDGFNVTNTGNGIIAEKKGEKIIITRLDNAKLVLNLKSYLFKQGLIAQKIGGIEFSAVLSFLEKEKKDRESYIDCLKRVARKFNWDTLHSGELELSGELGTSVGEKAQYLEIETDDGQLVTLLNIFDLEDNQKIYATNQRFFKLMRKLNSFNQIDAFKSLAPRAFLVFQNVIN